MVKNNTIKPTKANYIIGFLSIFIVFNSLIQSVLKNTFNIMPNLIWILSFLLIFSYNLDIIIKYHTNKNNKPL